MTDHTTQGTAGLIQRLADVKRECGLANYEGAASHLTIPQVLKRAELALGGAIAALSAKPAPVAEPVAWRQVVSGNWQVFLTKEEAGIHPEYGAPEPLYTSAPELAVADEGRFDALLQRVCEATAYMTGALNGPYQKKATECASEQQQAIEALRAYFKASRSPVQEGAQGVEPYAYAVEDVKFKQPPTLVFADRIGDYSIILSQPDRYKATPLYVAPSQAIPEAVRLAHEMAVDAEECHNIRVIPFTRFVAALNKLGRTEG